MPPPKDGGWLGQETKHSEPGSDPSQESNTSISGRLLCCPAANSSVVFHIPGLHLPNQFTTLKAKG